MTRYVKAAAALVVLAVLVVVPPWMLLTYVGNPWPAGGISWDQPLSDDALIGIIAAAVWVLWAQMMLCLVVEVVAAVTRDGARWRAPLTLGVQQQLVRRLVTAVVVTGVAAPVTVGTAFAAPAPGPAGGMSPVALQSGVAAAADGQVSTIQQTTEVETTMVTIKQGDSLWALSEEHLEDGQRWREIADLNEGRVMPDGRVFRSTGALQPGWQLQVPVVAPTSETPGGTDVVQAGDTLSELAQEHLGDATRYPELFESSRTITQPGGEHLVDPDHIEPGWTIRIPAAAEPDTATPQPEPSPKRETTQPPKTAPEAPTAPPVTPQEEADPNPGSQAEAPDQAGVATGDDSAGAEDDGQQWPIRTVGGIGALLAAALIALIAARRARQARRRKPGEDLPLPSPEAETTESAVRTVADPLTLGIVAEALRALVATQEELGRQAPGLWAARMSSEQLDLYLHGPTELPGPWTATDDPAVWTLDAAAVGDLPHPGQGHHPYPALVSVGHDASDAVVLLNLAQVQELALSGELAARSQTALLLELGSIEWADGVLLTVVGGRRELVDVLEPGRARYVPSLDQVDEIHDRPQVVITTHEAPTAAERDRIRGANASLVYLGDAAEGGWCMEVESVDHAVLQPIGLDLAPQVVDEGTYRNLVEILEVTQEAPTPRPTLTIVENEEPAEEEPEADVLVVGHEPPGEPIPEETPHTAEMTAEPETPEGAVPDTDSETTPPAQEETSTQGDESQEANAAASTEAVVDEEQPARARVRIHQRLQTGHPAIRVLGPSVDLIGATGNPPATQTHQRICTRIATYLAFHPGSSRAVLVDAIWNGQRIAGSTVDSRISQLRRWLGTNPETGDQYLPPRTLDLAQEITTDWDEFTTLVPDATAAPTAQLEEALDLVRGRPLEGEESKHYAWLEYDLLRIGTTLSDTCYELARRRYMDGTWAKAAEAAELGILLDPGNEYLWRLRIHTAHSAGNPTHAEQAIGRMLTRLQSDLGCTPEPETMELVKAVRNHDSDAVSKAAGDL